MKEYDFYKNPYLETGQYEVTKYITNAKDPKKIDLFFSNNIFYPGGGGQPRDTGSIIIDNTKFEILDSRKENDFIVLTIPKLENLPEKVTVKINLDRRKKLTIAHSSEHILFKVISSKFEDAKLIKINLDENVSEIFFESELFDPSFIKEIEQQANEIVQKKLPVASQFIPITKASEIKELRINKNRINEETIRIVKIGDFDVSACTGTHVTNTSEIPFIFVTNTNKSKNRIRLKFTNNIKLALEFASLSRDILIENNKQNLKEFVKNTINENQALKRDLRWLIKNIELFKQRNEETNVQKNNQILFLNLDDITKDLLNFIIKSLDRFILLSKINETNKAKIIIKGLSEEETKQIIDKLNLRGNLNKDIFQGVSENIGKEKIKRVLVETTKLELIQF